MSPFILEAEHIAFVTESIWVQGTSFQEPLSSETVVKWSDCCSLLACRPGDPYQLIAKASVDNFSKLGAAFMEDRLQMDNGLIAQKIVCKCSVCHSPSLGCRLPKAMPSGPAYFQF